MGASAGMSGDKQDERGGAPAQFARGASQVGDRERQRQIAGEHRDGERRVTVDIGEAQRDDQQEPRQTVASARRESPDRREQQHGDRHGAGREPAVVRRSVQHARQARARPSSPCRRQRRSETGRGRSRCAFSRGAATASMRRREQHAQFQRQLPRRDRIRRPQYRQRRPGQPRDEGEKGRNAQKAA